MSENETKNLINKIWISVASGMVLLIATSIFGQYWAIRETEERSLRTEKRVEILEQIKEDKEDNIKMHEYLLQQSERNSHQIEKTKQSIEKSIDKQDAQYQFIIEKLMQIQKAIK